MSEFTPIPNEETPQDSMVISSSAFLMLFSDQIDNPPDVFVPRLVNVKIKSSSSSRIISKRILSLTASVGNVDDEDAMVNPIIFDEGFGDVLVVTISRKTQPLLADEIDRIVREKAQNGAANGANGVNTSDQISPTATSTITQTATTQGGDDGGLIGNRTSSRFLRRNDSRWSFPSNTNTGDDNKNNNTGTNTQTNNSDSIQTENDELNVSSNGSFLRRSNTSRFGLQPGTLAARAQTFRASLNSSTTTTSPKQEDNFSLQSNQTLAPQPTISLPSIQSTTISSPAASKQSERGSISIPQNANSGIKSLSSFSISSLLPAGDDADDLIDFGAGLDDDTFGFDDPVQPQQEQQPLPPSPIIPQPLATHISNTSRGSLRNHSSTRMSMDDIDSEFGSFFGTAPSKATKPSTGATGLVPETATTTSTTRTIPTSSTFASITSPSTSSSTSTSTTSKASTNSETPPTTSSTTSATQTGVENSQNKRRFSQLDGDDGDDGEVDVIRATNRMGISEMNNYLRNNARTGSIRGNDSARLLGSMNDDDNNQNDVPVDAQNNPPNNNNNNALNRAESAIGPCAALCLMGICPDEACYQLHDICYDHLFSQCDTVCNRVHLDPEVRQSWISEHPSIVARERPLAEARTQERIRASFDQIHPPRRAERLDGRLGGITLASDMDSDLVLANRLQSNNGHRLRMFLDTWIIIFTPEASIQTADDDPAYLNNPSTSPTIKLKPIWDLNRNNPNNPPNSLPNPVLPEFIAIPTTHHDFFEAQMHVHEISRNTQTFTCDGAFFLAWPNVFVEISQSTPDWVNALPASRIPDIVGHRLNGPRRAERDPQPARAAAGRRFIDAIVGSNLHGIEAMVDRIRLHLGGGDEDVDMEDLLDEDYEDEDYSSHDDYGDFDEDDYDEGDEYDSGRHGDRDLRGSEYAELYNEPYSQVTKLTKAQLNRLLVLYKVKESDSALLEADPCTICLCSYEVGEELVTLPCFHRFHQSCADGWFKSPQSGQTCPQCRVNISKASRRHQFE
jgi:hypothetical protein